MLQWTTYLIYRKVHKYSKVEKVTVHPLEHGTLRTLVLSLERGQYN